MNFLMCNYGIAIIFKKKTLSLRDRSWNIYKYCMIFGISFKIIIEGRKENGCINETRWVMVLLKLPNKCLGAIILLYPLLKCSKFSWKGKIKLSTSVVDLLSANPIPCKSNYKPRQTIKNNMAKQAMKNSGFIARGSWLDLETFSFIVNWFLWIFQCHLVGERIVFQ